MTDDVQRAADAARSTAVRQARVTGDSAALAKVRLGYLVVIATIAAIVVTVLTTAIVLAVTKVEATSLAAVISPPITAIASLGAAFFGINLGQAGKEQAEEQRTKAEQQKDAVQAENSSLRASAAAHATANQLLAAPGASAGSIDQDTLSNIFNNLRTQNLI